MQLALRDRERHITELQEQVLLLTQGEQSRSSEQQARLSALVTSFNSLRETCEAQAHDVTDLTAQKRRLEEDKKRLKDKLTEMTALAASMQVGRGGKPGGQGGGSLFAEGKARGRGAGWPSGRGG